MSTLLSIPGSSVSQSEAPTTQGRSCAVLVVLVWMFLLLYWLQLTNAAVHSQVAVNSTPLQHKRSREPTPVATLIPKSDSAACEQ